jgi:shikimate kinase
LNARAVILVGFMGAGKTTAARALAARLGCGWLDLDELIEQRTGRAVPEIIATDGEPRFRELETDALRAALGDGAARVLALGGGAWLAEQNRQLVAARHALTVWLDAPFELCWQRLRQHRQDRPLARRQTHARQLYDTRRAAYRQADLSVQITPGKTVAAIVSEIIRHLNAEARTK